MVNYPRIYAVQQAAPLRAHMVAPYPPQHRGSVPAESKSPPARGLGWQKHL
ncbi:hypothetical protein AGMMS49928_05460 [Spirochaetia bacterium]|nr:hypothetical protein AGMMS49928_05460 [Spirochaetia bacterium]